MTREQVRETQALQAARDRRERLHRAAIDLERAIAAPASGRTAAWLARIFTVLFEVREAFEEHVVGTEGPDALFEEVIRIQPRLSHEIAQLSAEHDRIRAAVDGALAAVHELADDGPRAAEVREQILALLLAISRHRQRGADLVYEAYAVDIGGGD